MGGSTVFPFYFSILLLLPFYSSILFLLPFYSLLPHLASVNAYANCHAADLLPRMPVHLKTIDHSESDAPPENMYLAMKNKL